MTTGCELARYGRVMAHTILGLAFLAWRVAGNCTTGWATLSPSTTAPALRSSHAMAALESERALFMFGGHDGDSPRNDIWTYGVANRAWVALAPSGIAPSPRFGHAMAALQSERALFVFGGGDFGSVDQDTNVWKYEVASNAWVALSPTGTAPPPRRGHAMVALESERALFVFGGSSGGNDIWKYDVTSNAWVALAPSGTAPSPRRGQAMVALQSDRALFVFGGYNASNIYALNDIWKYDVASSAWVTLSPSGTAPLPRAWLAMVALQSERALFVFGGYGTSLDKDVWKYAIDSNAWVTLSPSRTAPSPQFNHAMVALESERALFALGGYTGVGDLATDFRKYCYSTRTALSSTTPLSTTRSFATALFTIVLTLTHFAC